jgi:ABC-type nickel/cobalt efflux system permease component RcnA
VERRPDPPPLETNDVAIITGGTALWAVALVVVLVLKATGTDVHAWWWQMCAAGALLGLLGIRYCRRRRDRLAAGAEH